MNSKGDANMWWIIIGAVLALVVVIVLMVIFTGRSNIIDQGLLDCQSKGGSCNYPTDIECRTATGNPSHSFECPGGNEQQPCCFGIKSS
ncbi:MAG TPA: hypothetical protein VJI32_07185 [Candidatus Nanoarchaeia archaeon]|nr:hypothetical protein [Candidatus Nanoarchaeia archaeon]